jgi:hypothetical protein
MVFGSLGLGPGGSLYMLARAQLRDLLQEMFEPLSYSSKSIGTQWCSICGIGDVKYI